MLCCEQTCRIFANLIACYHYERYNFLYKMVYNLENTGLQLAERLKRSFDN